MRVFFLIAALCSVACGAGKDPQPSADIPPISSTPRTPPAPPRGQLPESVTPERYELELTIVPTADRFSGRVKIDVRLAEVTDVLWLHGDALAVSRATVTAERGRINATWEEVGDDGVAALRLGAPVGPGRVTVDVAYDAPFARRPSGLYRVDVDDGAYAFTQFQPISARRAFPGFDEPRFKTPFTVSLTVRSDDVAASNAPVSAEETLPGGMKRVRFATTRPLPTYLVALAVGPLAVVEAPPIEPNPVRGTDLSLRGLAVSGRGEALAYALRETRKSLAWLEDYFGRAYPYEKLDIVAVPDFTAGGMENAGLVMIREWPLLVDPETSTEAQKRAFAYVMAHELAHMWFGNLVTMPWWDDLWLNEAFATWMGSNVVRGLYPNYEADIAHVQWAQRAMGADSLASTRRIRQPIESNHDIENAFDVITYLKGGAVIEMFERWMGEENFRTALRGHLERHAFQTATANDLLASLQATTDKPVVPSFRTLLSQPGVPFVEAAVECSDGGARLRLTQRRFLPVGSIADSTQTWSLPVCARFGIGEDVRTECALIDTSEGQVALGEECPSWVMPNADAAGYYRFALPSRDFAALRRNGWRSLSTREQLAVADSLRAAFNGGTAPAAEILSALEPIGRTGPRQVAAVAMEILGYLDDHVVPERLRENFRRYSERVFLRRFRRLGWGSTPGATESAAVSLLRSRLVLFLGDVARSPRVRRVAGWHADRYLEHRTDRKPHPDAVDPNLLDVSLRFAVQDGDLEFFDLVFVRFMTSRDPTERRRLLGALSSVRDPSLAERVRALALDHRLRTDEVLTPLTIQFGMKETREATWAWLQDHFDDLSRRLDSGRLGELPRLAAVFCEAERAEAVEAFFSDRIEHLTGGPHNLAEAVETIRLCAARAAFHRESAVQFFSRLDVCESHRLRRVPVPAESWGRRHVAEHWKSA